MGSNTPSPNMQSVLVIAALWLCFLPACGTSYPSEADGKQVLETRSKNEGDLFKVKSFNKTNGQAVEFMGVKGYGLDYEAEVECLKQSWSAQLTPFPPPDAVFGDAVHCTRVGEVKKVKGTIRFEQTEKGWRPVN